MESTRASRHLRAPRPAVYQAPLDSPRSSPRFAATLVEGGRRMVGQGEMRRGDGPWEPDLQLAYARIGQRGP